MHVHLLPSYARLALRPTNISSPYSQLPTHMVRAFSFAGVINRAGAAAGFFAAATLHFAAALAFALALVAFAATLGLGAMALGDRLDRWWQKLDTELTLCIHIHMSSTHLHLADTCRSCLRHIGRHRSYTRIPLPQPFLCRATWHHNASRKASVMHRAKRGGYDSEAFAALPTVTAWE